MLAEFLETAGDRKERSPDEAVGHGVYIIFPFGRPRPLS
jgi:hypothetical protein